MPETAIVAPVLADPIDRLALTAHHARLDVVGHLFRLCGAAELCMAEE